MSTSPLLRLRVLQRVLYFVLHRQVSIKGLAHLVHLEVCRKVSILAWLVSPILLQAFSKRLLEFGVFLLGNILIVGRLPGRLPYRLTNWLVNRRWSLLASGAIWLVLRSFSTLFVRGLVPSNFVRTCLVGCRCGCSGGCGDSGGCGWLLPRLVDYTAVAGRDIDWLLVPGVILDVILVIGIPWLVPVRLLQLVDWLCILWLILIRIRVLVAIDLVGVFVLFRLALPADLPLSYGLRRLFPFWIIHSAVDHSVCVRRDVVPHYSCVNLFFSRLKTCGFGLIHVCFRPVLLGRRDSRIGIPVGNHRLFLNVSWNSFGSSNRCRWRWGSHDLSSAGDTMNVVLPKHDVLLALVAELGP